MFDQHHSQSLQERTLNLTVALYRVTDYFPKVEILRSHLRAKANEIFEGMIEYENAAEVDREIKLLIQKIKTVKGYLAIASTLNYVRALNFSILEKEYSLIEQSLEGERARLIKQQVHKDIQQFAQSQSVIKKNNARSMTEGDHRDKNTVPDITELNSILEKTNKERVTAANGLFVKKNDKRINERQTMIIDRLKESGQAKISDFYASFNSISSKTIQRDLQGLVDKQLIRKEGEKRWTVYLLISNNQAQKMSVL